MISKYYPRILAAAAVMIFFTNLCLYLYSTELVSFPPLYWITALGVVAAPICLSRRSIAIIRRSLVARWGYGFVMISGVWLLFQPSQSEIVWQEFHTRILSVLFVIVLLCLFSREDTQLWARYATLVAVLMGVGINLFEVFNPLKFSEVMGRSAGLYINPNQSAVALILGMIITVGLLPHRYRMLFLVVVGLGVFLTFSRAAIIGWLITFFVIVKTGQISLRRSLSVGCAVLAITFAVAVWKWDTVQYQLEDLGVLNKNVLSRIDWFNDMKSSDLSTVERKEVAELGWTMFSDSPVLGNGVGASIDWSFERSSHNEYLNLMVDHGILGLFILPLLVLATAWRARGKVRQIAVTFAVFILFWGFFSHNVLSERHILMMFSLLATMVSSSQLAHPADEKTQHENPAYYHCFAR